MSVKELLNSAKPLYDDSGQQYGVFLSNMEWETLITYITVDDHRLSERLDRTIERDKTLPDVLAGMERTVLPTMSGQVQDEVDITDWASVVELVDDGELKAYDPA